MLVTDFFLRKISISISILGILVLAFFSSFFLPQEVQINSISSDFIGKQVIVKGIVKNPFYSKNTLLFEVYDPDKITAVKFSPTKTELELVKAHSFLKIRGTIKKYREKIEIVVERVKKID